MAAYSSRGLLGLRLLDPSAARCPAARTSATFLGERPRSAPPVWWERGGLLERLRSDSGFSQERARPGSTVRTTSLGPALLIKTLRLSLQQIPVRSLCEKFFLLQSFESSSCVRSWASGVKPALSSRCRFSLALAAPGGGLDSEFILTVNIHCLCPVPVPVCLLLFSSVPGSTGVPDWDTFIEKHGGVAKSAAQGQW